MYTTTKVILSVITIITIFSAAIITVSTGLFLFSPMQQQIQLMIENSSDNYGHDNYYYHMAFAYHGKEISQKLNYAHFLPLTSNNQTHQIKVVVNYSVTDPS